MFWTLPQPLLAAGFDWLEAVLPLLFLSIWVLSQIAAVVRRIARGVGRVEVDDDNEADIDLTELFREKQNGSRRCSACGTNFAAPVAAHALCPECGQLTAAQDPDNQAQEKDFSDDSTDEAIAAFLKRFQHDAAEKKQPAALPVPPPAVPLPVRPSVSRSNSVEQRQRIQSRRSIQPLTKNTVPANKADGISQHVHEVFDKGLSHLPEGVVESPWADLELEDKGQPQLGNANPKIHSDSLAAVLANPITIRQAVVLREVLDRPIERW